MVLMNENENESGSGDERSRGDPDGGQSITSERRLTGLLRMRLPRMIEERRAAASTGSSGKTDSEILSTAEKSVNSYGSAPFFSPSSKGSFPDRRKKKPKFQLMLENAREEESKHQELRKQKRDEKKPLFQRILEKAAAESDREEKQKNDEYKTLVARKRGEKIPPALPQPNPSKMQSSALQPPAPGARKTRHTALINRSRLSGSDLDAGSQSSDIDSEVRVKKRIVGKKTKPLFERLAAQAKVDAEREKAEKLAK